MVNYSWQSVDAVLDDVHVTKTIVWCSNIDLKTIIFQCVKNYGSPTHVTKLKVVLNMTDQSVLTKTYRSLNTKVTKITQSEMHLNPYSWVVKMFFLLQVNIICL